MGKVLRCECGFEVHADEEAALVARVQRHALEAHGMRFSPQEVLRLAFRAELNGGTWQQGLGGETHEDA
jgi:predicted small metal-binding protein